MSDDLELKDLEQFSGTEQYHKVLGFNVTDGVAYIMNNGYSWFVTDFLVSARMKPKLRGQEFLSIKLELLGDNKAIMEVTDGNENVLYKQQYSYTNAKKELNLYLENGVLLLSGEH